MISCGQIRTVRSLSSYHSCHFQIRAMARVVNESRHAHLDRGRQFEVQAVVLLESGV